MILSKNLTLFEMNRSVMMVFVKMLGTQNEELSYEQRFEIAFYHNNGNFSRNFSSN